MSAQSFKVSGRGARSWRREAVSAWPLLQGTAAATLAWLIAMHVARHHQPFFAPIAAIVGLNTTIGERGANTFRLLLGVFIGIVVGEVTIALMGGGYGRLALAMFTAMIVARIVDGERIVIAQAAASAILTVAVADGRAGTNRLGDALIGASMALLFSQVLFSPEPVGLIRRSAVSALGEMAHLLLLAVRSLREDEDGRVTEDMLDSMRELRDRLGELRQMAHAGGRVVKHSLYWRTRGDAVARETAAARHLELLGGSLMMLVRSAMAADAPARRTIAPLVQELGEAITELTAAVGDPANRQHAADRALGIARRVAGRETSASPLATATLIAGIMATDLIAFLGVELVHSIDVVRDDQLDLVVPPPPTASRLPFRR